MLHWIRQSAIFLKPYFESDNHEDIEAARQGHKDLLVSFYAEVSDYMPLSQHKAAEEDFEYFLRLLDLMPSSKVAKRPFLKSCSQ